MGRGSGGGYGSQRTRQSIIKNIKAAGYTNVRARAATYRRAKGYIVTGKDRSGRDMDIFGDARWLKGYFKEKASYISTTRSG